jgi:tRNA nucleotidyltransferase (CCA-adding enzyme)
LIRVLHSLSFIDDPTRILRAARLAQRLDFRVEARTAELLQDSLSVLDQVTGDRVRHEIELALREEAPAAIMARMDALGVWEQLHPQLGWGEETAVCFRRVPQVLADARWREALREETPVFVYFALWMLAHPLPTQEAVMRRLKVRKDTRRHVLAVARLEAALAEVGEAARPSQVERTLRPFPPRVLLVGRIAWADRPAATLLSRYYHEWRHVKTAVDGNDLQEMGLEPGPQFAQWLDQLLAARLDGRVETKQEELALVREMVAERQSGEVAK